MSDKGKVAAEKSSALLERLQRKFGAKIVDSKVDLGDAVVRVAVSDVAEIFPVLKTDADFKFSMLVSVTVVDWLDAGQERFEVVYHLLSLETKDRLRVKVWVSEAVPRIPTMSHLWHSANYMEREAWDLLGIVFENHPDLRRILTYDEFKGHPLRKDYPVQGKQPRVKMRSPEVRNTALDMKRPALVQINRNKKSQSGPQNVSASSVRQ